MKKPGLRIDGGKRIKLNRPKRQRSSAPVEDTRVAAAWEREEGRAKAAARAEVAGRRQRKLIAADGGKDNSKLTTVKVRVSSLRTAQSAFRSKPGTFSWRYGRNVQSAEFNGGSHLAHLYERAGMTIASSANFMRGTRSGYATGISDGRLNAIDKLDGVRNLLGSVGVERMVDFCVHGLTTREIAGKNGEEIRAMATILHHDLRKVAEHFGFRRRVVVHKDRSGRETD